MAVRPTKPVIYAQFVALAAALAVAILSDSMSDWDLGAARHPDRALGDQRPDRG